MEKYVKESQDASISNDIIGLYDKELHMEKLRLSEKEEARHAGIVEIAKKMLDDGLSSENISKYTGLTLEEIENLK